ncbi:FkbM family methyltransferase [Streptomyces kaniharaensis]|nr:FkbM family methyltransferase [Streptomyces kaniharaensis]
MAVIRAGRACLKGTAIGQLPLSGIALRRLVRFGHGSGDVTADFRGLALTVPTSSASIAAGLFGGFYESIELELFEKLCAQSRTVVDVGANLGIYSCLAVRHLDSGGVLVAFEPEPGNLARLKANLRRNGAGNVADAVIEPVAVGDVPGTATLRVADDVGLHSVAVDGGSGLTVPQVSLDTCLPEVFAQRGERHPVDVLKIDVEGYDGHVLRGARRTIAEDRPALLIEFSVPQLRRCGFAAREFVDLLAETYDEIHIIEESRRRVLSCAPEDLLAARYRARLVNVVAAVRPEHRRLFADWASRYGERQERRLVSRA